LAVASKLPVEKFQFNETDFVFDVQNREVFLSFTFSHVNSTSDLLVLLPFNIENVSQWLGGPGVIDLGYTLQLRKPVAIGQNYWLENASFVNRLGYTNKSLNGTTSMIFHLGEGIMNEGMWQNSLLLSFGSNTSPVFYSRGCYFALRFCSSAFPKSPVSVSLSFPENQIIGSGTLPSPTRIATNAYARAALWNFSSSRDFSDIEASFEAYTGAWNSQVPWTSLTPLPSAWETVVLSIALVIMPASVTWIVSDRKRVHAPEEPSGEIRYII
jgi:hypothetical protein